MGHRQKVSGVVKLFRRSVKKYGVRRQNGLGHPNSRIWASLRSSRDTRFLEQAVLARVIPNPKLAEERTGRDISELFRLDLPESSSINSSSSYQ